MKSSSKEISYQLISVKTFIENLSYLRFMFELLDSLSLKNHNLHMAFLDFMKIYQEGNGSLIVIKQNDVECGLAFVKHAAPVKNGAYRLELMFIKEQFRGQGIGTTFTKDMVKYYKNKGYGISIACEKALISFYKKAGFANPHKVDGWRDQFYMYSPLAKGDAKFYTVAYDLTLPNLLQDIKEKYEMCRKMSGIDTSYNVVR